MAIGMSGSKPFDAVVFAGGGCRCFWQLGFWSVAAPELGLRPRVAVGVSAGTAMATAALLGRCRETLELFKEATARNPRNIYPGNLLRGEPLFPHFAMYRQAILDTVDEQGLARLNEACDLRLVVARPPRHVGSRLSLLLGLGCYLWDRNTGDPVHGGTARSLGFSADVLHARSCSSVAELADLILASSCTPPFTPALRQGGRPVIDGSLVESAPVFALDGDEQRTLVLLSRRYRTAPPSIPGRAYVAPSRPITLSKWDYTNPDGLQLVYDMGQEDAISWLRSL